MARARGEADSQNATNLLVWVSLSGSTYAKINTYNKINVHCARECEQTMQTFENAFSLILGDIIQI